MSSRTNINIACHVLRPKHVILLMIKTVSCARLCCTCHSRQSADLQPQASFAQDGLPTTRSDKERARYEAISLRDCWSPRLAALPEGNFPANSGPMAALSRMWGAETRRRARAQLWASPCNHDDSDHDTRGTYNGTTPTPIGATGARAGANRTLGSATLDSGVKTCTSASTGPFAC